MVAYTNTQKQVILASKSNGDGKCTVCKTTKKELERISTIQLTDYEKICAYRARYYANYPNVPFADLLGNL